MSLEVLLTLLLGFASSWGATKLKMPSGSILGPMIVVGGLQLSEALPLVPLGVEWRFIALCIIGTDMRLITALLGLSPGGASEMAAAALDFHADAGVVAALHMVRQISVFMTIPLVFKLAGLRTVKKDEA
jgi:uncharacterized membrane protein AbrB (regulator of aidB expression)